MDDRHTRERVGRVEALLDEVEGLPDPAAREKAIELVQALLDLYGEGLGRLCTYAAEHGGDGIARAVADDELVSHLLLLHGLHPEPLEDRVRGALDEVRPYLESHGGDVELLAVEGGIVRLRLDGSCKGCPSSSMTLKLAIEDAIGKVAPDVEAIEAEGAAPAPAPTLIQLEVPESNGEAPGSPPEEAGWTIAGQSAELGGGPRVEEVDGTEVLFLGLPDALYAYRPDCPGCGRSLAGGQLEATDLACPGCGNRYDVLRAGRCLDAPQLHLEPVPLLVDDAGLVKVALGAPA